MAQKLPKIAKMAQKLPKMAQKLAPAKKIAEIYLQYLQLFPSLFVVGNLEPEDWKDDVTDSLQLLHRLDPERV